MNEMDEIKSFQFCLQIKWPWPCKNVNMDDLQNSSVTLKLLIGAVATIHDAPNGAICGWSCLISEQMEIYKENHIFTIWKRWNNLSISDYLFQARGAPKAPFRMELFFINCMWIWTTICKFSFASNSSFKKQLMLF